MARREQVYGKFAKYYDFVYEGLVDYGRDVRFLEAVFRKFLPRRPRTILDLGCGTGSHAIRFARRGHVVTGVDISREQIALARRKARVAGVPVRFIQGDMSGFDLGTTFDAAVCLFGGFGHLLETRDVVGCFRSVRRHLAPGGLFAFEFWHSSGVRPPPYQSWLHRVGRGMEVIRLAESRYDRQTRLLPIEFRFFVLRGRRLIDRFGETHTLRTYVTSEMRGLLRRGGLSLLASFGGAPGAKPGFGRVGKKTFRVLAVCRPARA